MIINTRKKTFSKKREKTEQEIRSQKDWKKKIKTQAGHKTRNFCRKIKELSKCSGVLGGVFTDGIF